MMILLKESDFPNLPLLPSSPAQPTSSRRLLLAQLRCFSAAQLSTMRSSRSTARAAADGHLLEHVREPMSESRPMSSKPSTPWMSSHSLVARSATFHLSTPSMAVNSPKWEASVSADPSLVQSKPSTSPQFTQNTSE